MSANDTIPLDAFDREYNLAELLPAETLVDLLADMAGVVTTAVTRPDGAVLYGHLAIPAELARAAAGEKSPMDACLPGGRALAYPLVHELESIGALWVQAQPDLPQACMPAVAATLARALNRAIRMNYREKLAYGLHGQVVTESYQELRAKAEQLRQSQDKYRRLSESLEIEVRRKTREVEATQLALLQQEKLAAIGRLAGGMAHEINNPIGFVISNLNTLKGYVQNMTDLLQRYAQLALEATPDASAAESSFGAAIDAGRAMEIDFVMNDAGQLICESLDGARRVQAIVQNLRDFTHPSVESRESADLNRCLETTLAILAPQIPAGVTIAKAYRPIPQIACYLREINQVFYQILRNALQAVGAQGRIAIATGSEGDQVEIRIDDSGPGIPPENLGRVFDPFFTTREVGQGTGLGLHLAHGIVGKHGGTLAVESRPGQGSVFIVRLPQSASGVMD
jgi:signal transduction histidine kinase